VVGRAGGVGILGSGVVVDVRPPAPRAHADPNDAAGSEVIVVAAVVAAVVLVGAGLRAGVPLPEVILGGVVVVALGIVTAVLRRREEPSTAGSLLLAVTAAVAGGSIGWGAVEAVRFARQPEITVRVTNRCSVPLVVTGRGVSVPAREERTFKAPGVVVALQRDAKGVTADASVGHAHVVLAPVSTLTVDDDALAVGQSRHVDLADRHIHTVVACG
jgi:hypothetical protein